MKWHKKLGYLDPTWPLVQISYIGSLCGHESCPIGHIHIGFWMSLTEVNSFKVAVDNESPSIEPSANWLTRFIWRSKSQTDLTHSGLHSNFQVDWYLAVGKLGIDGLVRRGLVRGFHEQSHAKSDFLLISTRVRLASIPGTDSLEL